MSPPAQTSPQSEAAAASPAILLGRFMLPDTSEHPCQISELTAEGAVFLTSFVPPPGVTLVAYIDELGRVEAVSGEPVNGGFRADFHLSNARRGRIVERLQSMHDNNGIAQRRHVRFVPKDAKSHLTLLDGRTYTCEVIDISLSGAAVKIDVMPALGSYLALGKMRGRVVRFLEHGVAIEFARQLDRSTLAEHIE
ncbi:MAG: PilZ domain-containing protein [Parvibaculaceae bacterium]